MEYYSAINKNKILSFTATRRELEDTMFCEISQTQLSTAWSLSYVEVKNEVGLNIEEG